jgi:hypothetical protein
MPTPDAPVPPEWLRTNLANWEDRVRVHAASDFYDLPGFRAGRSSLPPEHIAEVGDVTGRSLLHLQCHMGQDTLSWARLGARVTGLDFSPSAIGTARSLATASLHLVSLTEHPAVPYRRFSVLTRTPAGFTFHAAVVVRMGGGTGFDARDVQLESRRSGQSRHRSGIGRAGGRTSSPSASRAAANTSLSLGG